MLLPVIPHIIRNFSFSLHGLCRIVFPKCVEQHLNTVQFCWVNFSIFALWTSFKNDLPMLHSQTLFVLWQSLLTSKQWSLLEHLKSAVSFVIILNQDFYITAKVRHGFKVNSRSFTVKAISGLTGSVPPHSSPRFRFALSHLSVRPARLARLALVSCFVLGKSSASTLCNSTIPEWSEKAGLYLPNPSKRRWHI